MRPGPRIRLRRLWRRHGRRLLVGAIAATILAAMGASTNGSPGRPSPLPQRAQFCEAVREAVRHTPEPFPGSPRELETNVAEACRRGPSYAPTAEPQPVATVSGCRRLDGPQKTLRPRSVAAPRRPIPFFAPRAGALPPNGSPTVGGVRLPQGSRCDRFWRTDGGVEDWLGLASTLASAFPRTGLWPLVWTVPHEPPDVYTYDTGDPARADHLHADAILRRAWNSFDMGVPFPGLAESAGVAGATDVDPFGETLGEFAMEDPPPGGWVVMLVPVNRPADVFSVLGSQTEYFRDDALSAVFRSWEERFGAVPATLGTGTVEVAVASPPDHGAQERRLAAEHLAMGQDPSATTPDALAKRYWALAWSD